MISRKRGKRKGPEFLEPAREKTDSARKRSLIFLISLTITGALTGLVFLADDIYLIVTLLYFVFFPILGFELLFFTIFSVDWSIKSRKLKLLLKKFYPKKISK